MINFSPSFIIDYLEEHYPELVPTSCGEYAGPGPTSDPDKKHLWVNSETGLWQDFKTGRSGNLISLVAYMEGITFSEAKTALMRSALEAYSIKVDEKRSKKSQEEKYTPVNFFDELELVQLTKETENDPRFKKAWEFIFNRGIQNTLETFPLYFTVEAPYPNRIIIPYIEDERMFFFQARAVDSGAKAKYLTPSKEYGVKSGNIIYPIHPKLETGDLHITEGPLKARLLQSMHWNATSVQGSKLSLQQARIIKRKAVGNIILSFDNDEAGTKAQENAFGLLTRKLGIAPNRIWTSRPDPEFNDWEDVFGELGESGVYRQITRNCKNMGRLEHLIDQL